MGGVKGEISEKSKLGTAHPQLWLSIPFCRSSKLTFDQIHSLALVHTLVAYIQTVVKYSG